MYIEGGIINLFLNAFSNFKRQINKTSKKKISIYVPLQPFSKILDFLSDRQSENKMVNLYLHWGITKP